MGAHCHSSSVWAEEEEEVEDEDDDASALSRFALNVSFPDACIRLLPCRPCCNVRRAPKSRECSDSSSRPIAVGAGDAVEADEVDEERGGSEGPVLAALLQFSPALRKKRLHISTCASNASMSAYLYEM